MSDKLNTIWLKKLNSRILILKNKELN